MVESEQFQIEARSATVYLLFEFGVSQYKHWIVVKLVEYSRNTVTECFEWLPWI